MGGRGYGGDGDIVNGVFRRRRPPSARQTDVTPVILALSAMQDFPVVGRRLQTALPTLPAIRMAPRRAAHVPTVPFASPIGCSSRYSSRPQKLFYGSTSTRSL